MTNQSAQPITEKELAEKLESISASMLGLDKKEAWTRVAREAAELMGYEFTPEKPAPGLYLHEDGRPIIMIGPNFTEPDSYLTVVDDSLWADRNRDKLTPARIVPVTAAPVVLTEDQVGEEWDAVTASDPKASLWLEYPVAHRARFKAVANALLAKHAAPAEGEQIASAAKPIDPADVRVGDRVRLVLRNGEATFIVANAYNNSLHSTTNTYYERDITAAYLLDREGETND